VVAVDAIPVMIEWAALRFSKEIADAGLTPLQAAIADAAGTEVF
jgi:hypothetical protein